MSVSQCSCVSVRAMPRVRSLLLAIASAAAFAAWSSGGAKAAEAEAAGVKHKIAVFLAPLSQDDCYFNGNAKAIKQFVAARVADINRSPEFPNQSFRFEVFPNSGDAGKPEGRRIAEQNMRKALADPAVVAMVGLTANRAGSWFKEMGQEIAASNIPFLSDINVAQTFAGMPNVFSMRPSEEEERAPVVSRFLQDSKFERPALIGSADSIGIDAFVESLRNLPGAVPLAAVYRVASGDLGPVSAIIDDMNAKQADAVIVSLGTDNGREFLKQAAAAQFSKPILFVGGNETLLESKEAEAYGKSASLFQLYWESVPGVFSNRLREAMQEDSEANWLFEDTKNTAAPGWKSNDCKDKGGQLTPLNAKIWSSSNLNAIRRGTQFADMIGLIGEAAKATYQEQSIPAFRKAMLDKLKSDYVVGSGVYRGHFDNWSFRPTSRSASRTPFIAMRARGEPHVQLAPTQYARLRSDALRPIQTVYMDLNVERVFRVDDSDKSFFAEFYISMRSNEKFDISSLEFGNAFREADKGAAKVTVSMVHDGAPNGVYPEGVSIARVVGKFMTSPNLSDYPFDTQLFSIQIQPKTYDAAFIIQPPHQKLRDGAIAVDSWKTLEQYVGLDEDYVPITDARSETRSIVPFYKMNFSWIMKRDTGDYYWRVVIPLAFILFVGYLSVFIPREHFEAIITIQVTALLSAVALYLSIPKVGSDEATISDQIFLWDYFFVSLMIAISILRVNWWVRARRKLDRALTLLHAIGIPLLIVGVGLYVFRLDVGNPLTFSVPQVANSLTATKGQP